MLPYDIITEKDVERLVQLPKPNRMFGIHFPDESDFDDIIETLNDPYGDPDVQMVLCKTTAAQEIYDTIVGIMNEEILDSYYIKEDNFEKIPVSCVVIAQYDLPKDKSLLVYFDYQLDWNTSLLIEMTEDLFQDGPGVDREGFESAEACHFDLDQINDNPKIMKVLKKMGIVYVE